MLAQIASAADANRENICRRGGGDDAPVVLQRTPEYPEVHLNVDQGYFDRRPRTDRVMRRQSMLIFLKADDFAPWPRDVRRSFANGPLVLFLVTNVLPLDIVADRSAKSTGGYLQTDNVAWQDAPGPFGLIKPTAPPPENPRTGQLVGRNDIYFARGADGVITDLLRCRRPGKVRAPSCQHIIGDRVMALSMDYSAELLPEWADISARARAFFD